MNNWKQIPHKWYPEITIGILPASYMKSLTYLEQVLALNKKINEIIQYLEQIDISTYENLINEKFEEIKEYIDKQDEDLYNRIDIKLNNEIDLLKNLINEKVIYLLEYVNNKEKIIYAYLEEEILKLQKEIENITFDKVEIYNPTTGKKDTIQNTINDLYTYLRYYGITADEFDALGLTCELFESKNLTAREFDLYSKCKLLIDLVHNMFSPFTGEIVPLQQVIEDLASLHKSQITAIEFDELDLTAEEFDLKDLTAYQFDWEGKTLLVN